MCYKLQRLVKIWKNTFKSLRVHLYIYNDIKIKFQI
jgi:hypothetical protein